jgi:hypothetical protein
MAQRLTALPLAPAAPQVADHDHREQRRHAAGDGDAGRRGHLGSRARFGLAHQPGRRETVCQLVDAHGQLVAGLLDFGTDGVSVSYGCHFDPFTRHVSPVLSHDESAQTSEPPPLGAEGGPAPLTWRT